MAECLGKASYKTLLRVAWESKKPNARQVQFMMAQSLHTTKFTITTQSPIDTYYPHPPHAAHTPHTLHTPHTRSETMDLQADCVRCDAGVLLFNAFLLSVEQKYGRAQYLRGNEHAVYRLHALFSCNKCVLGLGMVHIPPLGFNAFRMYGGARGFFQLRRQFG